MTKRRKSDARYQQEATGEEMRPPQAAPRGLTTEEELERRMRSALADVYEVLGFASVEGKVIEWSEIELINDLVH